jgi:hypothetical protein
MSDKAEDFAKLLLEKTEGGKLCWQFVPGTPTESYWTDRERYRTDIEDGFSFSIERRASGDNKILDFQLTRPGGVVLSARADNLPLSLAGRSIMEQGDAIVQRFNDFHPTEAIDSSRISRFRLFSDLFRAARNNAAVEDTTIEKVQQLLERLG